MPRRLSDLQAIRRFLLGNERPICFISPSSFSLFGLEGLVGGMRFILRHNCFEGHRPDVFIPSERWADASLGVVETNNHLLRHPEVVEHLKALGPHPAALFLMFDEETEALCQGLGVEFSLRPRRCATAWMIRWRPSASAIAPVYLRPELPWTGELLP